MLVLLKNLKVNTNGTFSSKSGRVYYDECHDFYSQSYDLESDLVIDANSIIHFKLTLSGWDDVKYLALGLVDKHGFYHHYKIVNPLIGTEFLEKFRLYSLAYRLTHDVWDRSKDLSEVEIKKIKVFLKAKRASEVSYISLSPELVIEDFDESIFVDEQLLGSPKYSVLKNHEVEQYSNYLQYADEYVNEGVVNLRKIAPINWALDVPQPSDVDSFTTTRFLWLALNLVEYLGLAYEERPRQTYLFAVHNLISHWLQNHFYKKSSDMKYAWYDHGVAIRQLALLRAYRIATDMPFDFRFIKQLEQAVVEHAELLESEFFYSRNQRNRIHNHALFQDVALLASSLYLRKKDMEDKAVSRITEQFEGIVSNEGASVENSTGYHVSTTEMCHFVAEFSGLASLSALVKKMNAFTEAISYPDGGVAAIGDSYYSSKKNSNFTKNEHLTWFKESGYVCWFYHLDNNNKSVQLNFIASSQSSVHKHEDNLHFTLWCDGYEWLADVGFYSHQYDDKWNLYSRGVGGHNALHIASLPYSIEPGKASVEVLRVGQTDQPIIVGKHGCYADGEVKRTVSIEQNVITVVDELSGFESLQELVSLNLPLAPAVSVSELGEGKILLSIAKVETKIILHLPDDINYKVIRGFESDDAVCGWVFPAFAEKIESYSINCTLRNKTGFIWKLEII